MKLNYILLFATLITGSLFMNGCSDDEDGENWAAAVEGTYVGTCVRYIDTVPATTIVTRIQDRVLNFQVTVNNISYCFDSVNMTSSSTITITEFDACRVDNITGAGNFSGNNITYNFTDDPPFQFHVTATK